MEKFGKKVKAINYNYKKRTRRQDSPKQYVENGSFYITKKEIYKKTNNRLGGKISHLFQIAGLYLKLILCKTIKMFR